MKTKAPTPKYLKDYQAPHFGIESIHLNFELGEDKTVVTTKMLMHRQTISKEEPLILDGEDLELQWIKLNNSQLTKDEYQLNESQLIIPNVPNDFELQIQVFIKPQENTSLSGLYKSSNNFCTQCEAQGFRRITYFLDRPDVMTKYTTTIIADKTKYPILLSNGNPIEFGDLTENNHFITWQDPFKKPSYLFALVAGNLDFIEDKYETLSGAKVTLKIYVEKGNKEKAKHAMHAVKSAMNWDEQTFAREYDLDIYMIVAVSDFNMGAMENKGLNIFNDKYILANPEIATDADYEAILEVVGHEYFHNWTGNRITCRDWFQLSLKEGLTIFRDQEFTADMTSRAVKRIKDARILRTYQYPEDAGPMAHPVQPDSYIEIDNFYTHTVYEKGSEVIRMMQTLLGKQKFLNAMELYFVKNDGLAVTIEEFVKAMEEAGKLDLTQFRRWYKQAGTPELDIKTHYNPTEQKYTISIQQHCPTTPGQEQKQPFQIPLNIGLLNEKGESLPLQLPEEAFSLDMDSRVLEIKQAEEEFTFINLKEKPIISLLRNFSAPIKIHYDYSLDELALLMTKDSNPFSQWEAGQRYFKKVFFELVDNFNKQQDIHVPEVFIEAFKTNLTNKKLDPSFVAELLVMPSEKYLMNLLEPITVEAAHQVHHKIKQQIAVLLQEFFLQTYEANITSGVYKNDKETIAKRKLKNTCLNYLAATESDSALEHCFQQYQDSNNMTDRIAALSAIVNSSSDKRDHCLMDFYHLFKDENLVIDKWFTLQATADHKDVLKQVKQLTSHDDFKLKNPNKVRALIGAFCMHNPYYFHGEDGAGHEFLVDYVIKLNTLNPQVAARLLEPLTHWRKFAEPQKNSMQRQLERIKAEKDISSDVYEIVEKSLY